MIKGRTLANKVYENMARLWLKLDIEDGKGPFDWLLERSTLLYEFGRIMAHLCEGMPDDVQHRLPFIQVLGRGGQPWLPFIRALAHEMCQRRPNVVREVAALRKARASGRLLAFLKRKAGQDTNRQAPP